jgi:alkanesulfonate monooxygenase SsuD/methylene tetrahydromethanopterin reductase-like flavin-dependent oxidoreductase (luciferase family)
MNLESRQLFAYLAGAGLDVPVGTAVSLMSMRHPAEAAVAARSVAALTGLPYVEGIGPGAVPFQAATLSEPYRRPAATAQEYLRRMRDVLDRTVTPPGDTYRFGLQLPEQPAPPVELGLGVLRAGMARTAGAVADVAITWLTPREYVRDTLVPAVAEGAERAGRTPPRISTVVHVAVARPGRDIRRTARAGAGAHLSAEHYTDMLRRAGLDVHADDPAAGADALVDAGVFVTGSPHEIAVQLQEHHRCGIDEVILNPAGVQLTERGRGGGHRSAGDSRGGGAVA